MRLPQLDGQEAAEKLGIKIMARLSCKSLMITQGENGLTLFNRIGEKRISVSHIPTRAREVFDVTGAGDTVISTFALAWASGASPEEAAMRSLEIMKSFGYPVIFDCTHSVQKPGALGSATGGDREFIIPLAKAAAVLKIAGLFFEAHPNPDEALSDGPNSIKLNDVKKMIKDINSVDRLASALSGGKK